MMPLKVRDGWKADVSASRDGSQVPTSLALGARLQGLEEAMRRDVRLLVAMFLFAVSLMAGGVQAWITALYIDAAVMGDWTWFAETFSVEAPASGPNTFCLDYCAADFPFIAGWIGIGAFVLGWIMLAYAWWKPRD